MPIDFPPSPSVGDQITGPYGEVYTWDGVAWSITAGGENGGGGAIDLITTGLPNAVTGEDTFVLDTQPIINQPTVMGVTDGSNAASGVVGEFLSGSNVLGSRLDSGNIIMVTQLSLPPGDWDVSGSVNFLWQDNGTWQTCSAWLFTTAAAVLTPPGVDGSMGGMSPNTFGCNVVVGVKRYSVSTATSVFLNARGTNTPAGAGGPWVNGLVRARRVR